MNTRDALVDLLHNYISLVNSGDCGHWDPEKEPVVINARKAIGDVFVIEHTNGFYWVTNLFTGDNYAQTDSRLQAAKICDQLNNGKR
jgi:hypothetical protein